MADLALFPVRRVVPVLVIAAMALGACGKKTEERVTFDGVYYKTKSSTTNKDDRTQFETVVRRPEQGIRGALAAGEHDGKAYCLQNFGTSDIKWTRGPNDPNAALYVEGGRLRLTGQCILW